MKILMIASYLPFPLYSGGSIRLYNLIKNLSQIHDITLICEKRKNQTEEDINEVKRICKKVITVDRGSQWSPKNILNAGFSTHSFLVVGHTHLQMQQIIRDELVREKYDLIHVETFYVYQNLPRVFTPVVLVEHNVEYLVYTRYAKTAKAFLKPLLYADIFKLKKEEEGTWEKANKLVAVSYIERKLMQREDVEVVPNGVDINSFKFRKFPKEDEEKRILFIGDFKWMQNKDALETILKDIWSEVEERANDPDLKLWVVGKNIPQGLKDLNKSKNVIFDEDNKDLTSEIYQKAYVLLAPLRIAGGTSYKILEAMASGVGVVTTNLGIEGLEAKNNVDVLAGEIYQLPEMVLELLHDRSLYKKLILNARKLAEKNYDWKMISEKLNDVYLSCFT